MSGALRRIGALGLLLSILVACSDLGGLTGGEDAAPGASGEDAGACGTGADLSADHDNCGACGTRCGETEHCLAGACAPGCPDHVVYVAEGGNDTNGGCSQKSPKRTIGSALALLKTLGAQEHEIHVCRGRYEEAVRLDYGADVLGGYECSTWMRTETGNEVIVAAPPEGAALTVEGVKGVRVEGLVLRGGIATMNRSRGVHVLKGASVVLAKDVISAASGAKELSPSSVGVRIEAEATAEIEDSTINGGSGVNEGGGYGSAGVHVVFDGALRLRGGRIDGGSGSVSSGTGSVGILALGGSVSAIERATILGGTGKTSAGSSSIGAVVSGTKGDLLFASNVIDGGAGSCTGACSVIGATLSPAGTLRAHGNRIFAGETTASGDARFVGLAVRDSASADVQNNQIFTGNTKNVLTGTAVALELRNATRSFIGQNTLVVGPTLAGEGTAASVTDTEATIVNNLLAVAGGTSDPAVRVSTCDGAKVVSFRNNVWVGASTDKPILAIDEPGPNPALCAASVTTATSVTAAEQALSAAFPGIALAGNARLASTCGGDAKCSAPAACATSTGCTGALLGPWDGKTANRLLLDGWKLAATAPCSIARGSGDVGGLLPTDAFGAPRTDPRSIGAHESDGACQ